MCMMQVVDQAQKQEGEVRAMKELNQQLSKEAEDSRREAAEMKREVEELKIANAECKSILFDDIKDVGAAVAATYKSSPEYRQMREEVGSNAYRRGFKLCRWLMKCEFLELNLGAITTIEITSEMVLEVDQNLDSEESNDELDEGVAEKSSDATVSEVVETDEAAVATDVMEVEPALDPMDSEEGEGEEPYEG
uniref:Uncharacterized protein n=1 Tax=Nelumbo nucifera TaxID=4432 RepID=A0A822XM41_NELNU|nr:TPA_asm: hypothetical protein HUJ06_021308 [Nelumbo nucifera]